MNSDWFVCYKADMTELQDFDEIWLKITFYFLITSACTSAT